GIISLSLSPNPVTGGLNSIGTVTIGAPAPTGGKSISLSSNAPTVAVPSSVTIAEGATSATFTTTTQPVAATLNATITSTGAENSLNAILAVNPPVVNGLSLNPASVAGGNASTGKVTISGPAPSGGKSVTLTSNKAAVTVPASVTISEGNTSTTFTVTTTPVTSSTSATITAKTGTTSKSATLAVKPPTPSSVKFSPVIVMAGNSSTGTVSLTGPAPSGGLNVALSSNKAQVSVPASMLVAEGETTANFTANTANVTANLTATISATANGVSRSGTLTVVPVLKSVVVSPTSVTGDKNATGTVNLNGAAPVGGVVVSLSTSNGAASVPATVTVAEGAASATFTVSTTPVSANTTGTISGAALGVTKSTGAFTVKPPALTGLSFSPGMIVSGADSTGKLTLSGPAPAGFTVSLTSADPSIARVPASVTFTSGLSYATFTVTGGPVSSQTSVQVTAKDPALVTKKGTLTVKP
ncbi:MAG: hypothetical protein HY248_03100, partial [Fimbriimonas ginsengisoli]|nr:hypothetical protein [Fimbriimonas ginsengisoli]